MLWAASAQGGKNSFRIGYVAGFTHYLISLYWLLLIPVAWFPILGWLMLSAYLAIYPAIWVWLVSALMPVPKPQMWAGIGQMPTYLRPGTCCPSQWAGRALWAFSGAAIWVALEMIRARLFTGFPWNLIGVSQYQLIPLIQIASLTGVYGVSFLVVWMSLSLFLAVKVIIQEPGSSSAWLGEIILALAVLTGVLVFGFKKAGQSSATGRELAVALVQPAIPQTLIWDPAENSNRFSHVLTLSKSALADEVELLIWPESAIPELLRYDETTYQAVTSIARSNRIWMIVGADDAEPRLGTADPNDADYFNSSFLINPDGKLTATYRKRNLVVFGEYVPLARWFPFLKHFTPISGSFTAGTRPVAFDMTSIQIRTATLICFEDIFPQLARENVTESTDFLVNLTNDGWFGKSAQQWQHAANAVFRAVENGVPLLRCCNNGLTCWMDANGRIRQIFRDNSGSEYGVGFMHAKIPLLAKGQKRDTTFYNLHGDWFGWGCVTVMFLSLIALFMGRKGRIMKVGN